MSVRVYVGNLPKDIEREQLEEVFSEHSEEIVSIKLVTDRKTGKCRGFGFVTVNSDEQADAIVEKFSNYVLQENTLKIEKALPRSKSKDEESSGGSGNNRRKGNKPNRNKSSNSGGSAEAAQPDPRWAEELEKLKQMLAAQTTGS
ncbi:RNA-binding protein [Oscillatoria sp. CS-180]|uniref:RNA recognition motif domain-containing protein n=1 Tax=Oscillatoria sp. CS-180 TaxID=3021720 RepID=UPI00232F2133|nr:RNA-binding protein [Oscillatoria sp. CS-180]MDB9525722.1 RNA-binding protein [Oscillatoria sp. CS-180]